MALPKRFPDRDEVVGVRDEAGRLDHGSEGEATRRLAGRIMARRDTGKLVFSAKRVSPRRLDFLRRNGGGLSRAEASKARLRGDPLLRRY